MKKIVKIIFTMVLVGLLSSCYTTSSEDNTSTYTPLVGNNYKIYGYSSLYDKETEIRKDDVLLVICNMENFSWRRPFEELLKEEFGKKGIQTILFSDYKSSEDDRLAKEVYEKDVKYSLYVSFGNDGNYMTFEYGGGISQISFDVELIKWTEDFPMVMNMIIDVDGTHNDLEKFNSTKMKIMELSSKKIVEEYLKYVK